jgi:hypothetical protein
MDVPISSGMICFRGTNEKQKEYPRLAIHPADRAYGTLILTQSNPTFTGKKLKEESPIPI